MRGHWCDLNRKARESVTRRFVCGVRSPTACAWIPDLLLTKGGFGKLLNLSFLIRNMEIKIVPTRKDSCADKQGNATKTSSEHRGWSMAGAGIAHVSTCTCSLRIPHLRLELWRTKWRRARVLVPSSSPLPPTPKQKSPCLSQ